MNNLKVAICDDEPQMIQEIRSQLEKMPALVSDIHEFVSGEALLEHSEGFDIIFLDIRMSSPDGMETAKRLRAHGCRSVIIFVTVLQEYVFDAFDVEACGFIVKPIDPKRFRKTVEHACRVAEARLPKGLTISKNGALELIPFADILFCEVQGRKIYIHRRDGSISSYYARMADLEKSVDGRFFRCHRSYLVNLGFIRSCQDGQLKLAGGKTIPVSRLREQDLKKALVRNMQRASR